MKTSNTPFLPGRDIFLDSQVPETSFRERKHRWYWESNCSEPLILQLLELPDEVMNAAAERLFRKGVGFGISRIGFCRAELEMIAYAVFNKPYGQVRVGAKSLSLSHLYLRATAQAAKQRKEQEAISRTIALFR